MDSDFLDMTLDPAAMEAFAKPAPGTTPLVVQHNHGFITAQKVEQPRDEAKVLSKIKTLAAMAGDVYYYEWPTKNRDGTTGSVSGGTIKLANDLARTYGNCINTIDCRKVGDHLLFKARFTDLETGYSLERMFQQRVAQNIGSKMDADRAADIVFQIGQSKAIRNVTLNALQTYADFAVDEARISLIEKFGKDIQKYQELARHALEDLGIDLANVERVIARPIDQWRARDLAKVRANLNSIRDGMATREDLFPAHSAAAPSMDSESMARQANAAAAGAPSVKETEPPPATEQQQAATEQQQPQETKPATGESAADKPKAEDKPKQPRTNKKKDDPKPAPEAKTEPPKATEPPPAKVAEDAPLLNDEGLAEGKDIYDQLMKGLNAAIAKCHEAGNDDELAEFNATIMDARKLLVEPWKTKFRDTMKDAWKLDFKK